MPYICRDCPSTKRWFTLWGMIKHRVDHHGYLPLNDYRKVKK